MFYWMKTNVLLYILECSRQAVLDVNCSAYFEDLPCWIELSMQEVDLVALQKPAALQWIEAVYWHGSPSPCALIQNIVVIECATDRLPKLLNNFNYIFILLFGNTLQFHIALAILLFNLVNTEILHSSFQSNIMFRKFRNFLLRDLMNLFQVFILAANKIHWFGC